MSDAQFELRMTMESCRSDIEFLQHVFEEYEEEISDDEKVRLLEIVPEMECNEYPDVWFGFVDSSLEIKVDADIGVSSAGRQTQTLKTVTVVLTTGGPHIEIVADCKYDRLELRGYWSTESCTLQVDAPGLYGHLEFYGSEMLSIR